MALTKKQLAAALSRDFETTLGSYASVPDTNVYVVEFATEQDLEFFLLKWA